MNTSTKTDKIDRAVALFRHLLTEVTSTEELAEELDRLMLEYATFLINDDKEGYPQRANQLYTIYQLKSICQLRDLNQMDKCMS